MLGLRENWRISAGSLRKLAMTTLSGSLRKLVMTGPSLRAGATQTSWGLVRGEGVRVKRELADISWIASQARDDGLGVIANASEAIQVVIGVG